MTSKVLNKMSSKQKTQNIEKNSFVKILGRKCTKYNFVAPLNFTDCYSAGLGQKLGQQFQLGTRTKTSQVKLYRKFQVKV